MQAHLAPTNGSTDRTEKVTRKLFFRYSGSQKGAVYSRLQAPFNNRLVICLVFFGEIDPLALISWPLLLE